MKKWINTLNSGRPCSESTSKGTCTSTMGCEWNGKTRLFKASTCDRSKASHYRAYENLIMWSMTPNAKDLSDIPFHIFAYELILSAKASSNIVKPAIDTMTWASFCEQYCGDLSSIVLFAGLYAASLHQKKIEIFWATNKDIKTTAILDLQHLMGVTESQMIKLRGRKPSRKDLKLAINNIVASLNSLGLLNASESLNNKFVKSNRTGTILPKKNRLLYAGVLASVLLTNLPLAASEENPSNTVTRYVPNIDDATTILSYLFYGKETLVQRNKVGIVNNQVNRHIIRILSSRLEGSTDITEFLKVVTTEMAIVTDPKFVYDVGRFNKSMNSHFKKKVREYWKRYLDTNDDDVNYAHANFKAFEVSVTLLVNDYIKTKSIATIIGDKDLAIFENNTTVAESIKIAFEKDATYKDLTKQLSSMMSEELSTGKIGLRANTVMETNSLRLAVSDISQMEYTKLQQEVINATLEESQRLFNDIQKLLQAVPASVNKVIESITAITTYIITGSLTVLFFAIFTRLHRPNATITVNTTTSDTTSAKRSTPDTRSVVNNHYYAPQKTPKPTNSNSTKVSSPVENADRDALRNLLKTNNAARRTWTIQALRSLATSENVLVPQSLTLYNDIVDNMTEQKQSIVNKLAESLKRFSDKLYPSI
jgi:hypothetical protein